jgi:hypothetical protein
VASKAGSTDLTFGQMFFFDVGGKFCMAAKKYIRQSRGMMRLFVPPLFSISFAPWSNSYCSNAKKSLAK